MYIENDCKFGFFVTRNSWSDQKYAMVVGIDGVEEGKMIVGKPPYFTRKYPLGHPKTGKVWPRIVHLKAPWLNGGKYKTDCGGSYVWTRVYPNL